MDVLRQSGSPSPGRGALSLTVTIKEVNALYSAYISFTKNGGLFIPTREHYRLGDEISMLLTLMDETEEVAVVGNVVWITPQGAQGNRVAGIGVEFSEANSGHARAKIETYLAGMLKSGKPTLTL